MIADFFEWYFKLFSDNDNKVRIAAWAATLATITFTISFIVKPSRQLILSKIKKNKQPKLSFKDLTIKYSFEELKKNVKIIVIDDHEIFPVAGFSQFGYNMTNWKNIDEQKLKRLQNGEFDIIILDIYGVATEIAENDGLDILQAIKNYNPAQVVVAYSGQSFDLSKNKFWELADEKLSKPTPFVGTQTVIDDMIEKTFTIDYHTEKISKILQTNNLLNELATIENLFIQFKQSASEPNWITELNSLNLKNGDRRKIASILKKLNAFTKINY